MPGIRSRYLDSGNRSRSPPGDAAEFRRGMSRLHLSGRVSVSELQGLSEQATRAGASGVHDIAATGSGGRHPGNTQRDLMRVLLRDSPASEPYFADVPTHCPRTGRNNNIVQLPFLLPHEIIGALCKRDASSLARLTYVFIQYCRLEGSLLQIIGPTR